MCVGVLLMISGWAPCASKMDKMLLEKTNELHSGCAVTLILKTDSVMFTEPVRRSPRSWEDRVIRSGLIIGNLGEGGGLGSFDSLDSGVSCVVLGNFLTSVEDI